MKPRPLPSATWRAPVAQDVAEHKAKLVIAFIPEQSQHTHGSYQDDAAKVQKTRWCARARHPVRAAFDAWYPAWWSPSDLLRISGVTFRVLGAPSALRVSHRVHVAKRPAGAVQPGTLIRVGDASDKQAVPAAVRQFEKNVYQRLIDRRAKGSAPTCPAFQEGGFKKAAWPAQ